MKSKVLLEAFCEVCVCVRVRFALSMFVERAASQHQRKPQIAERSTRWLAATISLHCQKVVEKERKTSSIYVCNTGNFEAL